MVSSRRSRCNPRTLNEVIDRDHTIGSVRDRLLERYLGFAFGGLHFEVRDISAEIAEARQMLAQFLGRDRRGRIGRADLSTCGWSLTKPTRLSARPRGRLGFAVRLSSSPTKNFGF